MNEQRGNWSYVVRVCLVATLGGLLFGYDTAVIAGAIGFLQKKFALGPAMEGWAASCALLGCVIGVTISGAFSDRFGRKRLLVLSGALFAASAIGTALPPNLTWFVIFRTIGGIGVGAASMAAPMYIAEIAPARMRGRMVSVNQLAIVTGMLIIYFVNYFIARGGDEAWNVEYGWRWMFASGLFPSLVFLGLLISVPESPRWLAEHRRRGEALGILTRVNGAAAAERELAEIEAAAAVESSTLSQFVRSGPAAVLVIGISLAILQQVTGINVFLYYGPEIFKKLGSGTDVALLQTLTVGAVNLVFTVIAIYTVDRWGRKPLMLLGASGMGICLFAMGGVSYAGRTELWVLLLILGYIACFALSIGPVTWVILSEIFPTKIRGRALGLATFCLWTANFIVSQTFPILNENAWLVATFRQAFPFWVYGALCVVEILFVWRMVPETKGKSLEEIERMW
ncbi:MAG: MFS transporter [Acidobacteria bacterium]|nr:MAG: MFS transporter [Acidobacteriota bacterium]